MFQNTNYVAIQRFLLLRSRQYPNYLRPGLSEATAAGKEGIAAALAMRETDLNQNPLTC